MNNETVLPEIDVFNLPVFADADIWSMWPADKLNDLAIDGKLVKVKHATANDLDVRVNNVKDNLIKIKQAAENELARIKEIQGVMRSKNLKFAGDALGYLDIAGKTS